MASAASPSSVAVRYGRSRGAIIGRGIVGPLNPSPPFRPTERRFASVAAARTAAASSLSHVDREETTERRLSADKLDHWVQESILEIVRHIGEAPFLVHVFANGTSGSSPSSGGLRVEREAATTESWPGIQSRWRTAAAPPPDGVILVEELAEEEGGEGERREVSVASGEEQGSSKTWGLLVQGRGADCASCYILQTCRVRSSAGFCTHFCLAKAKCFGDTAAAQLRHSWLLSH